MSTNEAFLAWVRDGVEKGYHEMLANDPACAAMLTTTVKKFVVTAMDKGLAMGRADGLTSAVDIVEEFSKKAPPVSITEIVKILRELASEEEPSS